MQSDKSRQSKQKQTNQREKIKIDLGMIYIHSIHIFNAINQKQGKSRHIKLIFLCVMEKAINLQSIHNFSNHFWIFYTSMFYAKTKYKKKITGTDI